MTRAGREERLWLGVDGAVRGGVGLVGDELGRRGVRVRGLGVLSGRAVVAPLRH